MVIFIADRRTFSSFAGVDSVQLVLWTTSLRVAHQHFDRHQFLKTGPSLNRSAVMVYYRYGLSDDFAGSHPIFFGEPFTIFDNCVLG